ncbi:3285_t:CDS:10 [Diversispora eburnea]|uniref:3285_t:CDS:1 n=1 Tax=Diversispora eburnea TaxID=1213867 RepID=A0A9N9F7T5_9GLOM|nr:3285_t:CDS:10 [Diversispora eburnea]
MEDTPVNAAHAFANAAEELEEKEQWAKAMEAHFRAAEQFLLAMNYTSDPEVRNLIRTLKLLYANHTRQGKESQRRVQQVNQRMQPKQTTQAHLKNPSHVKKSSTQSKSNAASSQSKNDSNSEKQESHPTSYISSRNTNERFTSRSGTNKLSSDSNLKRNPALSDSTISIGVTRDTPSVSLDTSSITDKTIDESYMLLRGNNDPTDDDDSDPFNKFWGIVESLVSKISNPVAFATVPLNGTDPNILFDPNTIPPPLPFGFGNGADVSNDSKVDELSAAMMESFFIIPNEQKPSLRNESQSHQRSSSSRMNPSSGKIESKNISNKTLEELSLENKQLKSILDTMSKRMLAYEKAAEENSMLRSSILQFKNDFQKQAKRIKVSQEMLRSTSVMKTSPESSTINNVQYLQKRVKELEEELRFVKSEKALMKRYKERWDKLTESAKAKKRRENNNKQGDSATPHQITENLENFKPSSSPKKLSNSNTTDLIQQPQTDQNLSSPTLYPRTPQLILPSPSEQAAQSPETTLPFAIQKPTFSGDDTSPSSSMMTALTSAQSIYD